MKKTRRFVALLLAVVLALAFFTACGAAEQPQPTIGEVYEDWFVEKVNVKHSEMLAALEKIGKDGKFTAGDGWDEGEQGIGPWYWIILSDPHAWIPGVSEAKAVALTPENMT